MKFVSVVGMGKLGLPLTLMFKLNGFSVIGCDVDFDKIKKLKNGTFLNQEPQVQDLLNKLNSSILFTTDEKEIIEKSDITFIVVPTPSKKDGSFSSEHVNKVINKICFYLKKKKQKHTIVVTSTLSPGTMELIKKRIEKQTNKKVGKEIGLCYSPELIALGSVIKNLTNPDFLFIGESDKESGDLVESIRKKICLNKPKIIRTNWINAELIKLSLNAYITTKISFANMIARMAENIKDADSEIILNAIGQDSRIGTKYLQGGLGFGGPCFPRDNRSLYSTIKNIGLKIDLPLKIDSFNKKQIDFVYKLVIKLYKKNQKIGILGLSYKPNTDVTEESQGILLAQKIIENKIPLIAFDPQVKEVKDKKIILMNSMEECITDSDVLIIATQWDKFKEIDWNKYNHKIIIDCWGIVDVTSCKNSTNRFVKLGKYI
ncbi:GDP-mannose 6-dehydrogenase [bioreactor metagenome]|uniref:UDP-glucose 6-dehydrogenase n=1 Tax=bioreactor metagenome TaxID=1076179 RepID=A0A644ZVW5_9ZZZZ